MNKMRRNVEVCTTTVDNVSNALGCFIAYVIYALGLDVALCEYFWGFETYFNFRNLLLCFVTAWVLDWFFDVNGLRVMWLVFIITVAYHFTK